MKRGQSRLKRDLFIKEVVYYRGRAANCTFVYLELSTHGLW
jgi:hypothetical protein